MDWPLVGLLIGVIASVAGAAWRFGRVEKAVSGLERDVSVLQADVKRILERLPGGSP